tara:strand:+ start:190 stop:1026 length:837 start_codon:yes stop_codon:yes gene_type:complete
MIDQKLIQESVTSACKKILKETEEIKDPAELEKEKQQDISKGIDKAGSRKPKSVKDSEERNPEVDEEEQQILKDKEPEKKDGDNKFSYDVPKGVPKNIKFQDIVDQLNSVRSGASLKDNEVKKGLLKYYDNLESDEKRDLFSMLSGFATIMNKAGDPENALNPKDAEKKEKPKKEKLAKLSNKQGSDASPIVVGEVARKFNEYALVAESNDKKHRCVNGKLVNFGSDKCISDIGSRIEDALDSRDDCARGTEKRSHYNGLLKYLRMQLRAAQKINEKP